VKPVETQLGRLLGSEDPTAQVQVAESLVRAVSAPVVSILLAADMRTGSVSMRAVAPEDLPFDAYYRILESARQLILDKERAALQTPAELIQPQE